MADEADTLREDILAAADEVEKDEVEEPTTAQATEETQEEIPEPTVEASDGEPIGADTPPSPQPEAGPKPPVDWPAEVQQAWGDLPEGVRNEVARREAQINETLRETAGIRHDYDTFTEMLQPYIPLMSAEGLQPMQAIEGLMKTTAALQMGSPQQKAQRVAGLIQHYGVDIEMLDQVLAGQPVADPSEDKFNQMLEQRMAPVNELLNRVNQAEQAAHQQTYDEAGQDISSFANDGKHPYFEQVRLVMADFLDMAAQQGVDMSLEDAYNRACLADPQVAPEYTRQYTQDAGSMLQGKREAASSIHGAGSSGAPVDGEMSLRETIEAQFGGSGRI